MSARVLKIALICFRAEKRRSAVVVVTRIVRKSF